MPTSMPVRKVAVKAGSLLKRLRPKQSHRHNGKEDQKDESKAVAVVASLDNTEGAILQREPQLLPPPPPRYATRAATSRTVPGKRHRAMPHEAIAIHEDAPEVETRATGARKMSAQERGLPDPDRDLYDPDSDGTESDEEVDESVLEDMRKLEESFTGISRRYRLVNRIGEGTFSTVYKAEQLDLDDDNDENNPANSDEDSLEMPASKRRKLLASREPTSFSHQTHKGKTFVALKKIYVTSSPHRIFNELELLHELRKNKNICPLLTAFRHQDQVIAVLPYFRHLDFRLYYQKFLTNDIRRYFYSLLSGLKHVHELGIIHRDIKPTNFLYDQVNKRGVLVDFGLAEREGQDWQPCLCRDERDKRRERMYNSYYYQIQEMTPSTGYPKHDSRPSRRANRAGTRGFRAPEVLFKCTAQTTKIDIWSTGVILLTILARRFPFFNSSDDVDATMEIASIFGKKKMQHAALMHGQVFETNIETIGSKGFAFEKIIRWAAGREKPEGALHDGEIQAIEFLNCLLELDPQKRYSAQEALDHDFLTNPQEDRAEMRMRLEAEGLPIPPELESEFEEEDSAGNEDQQ